jgi:hypothetical protein
VISAIMNTLSTTQDFYINSSIYKEFLEEREEVLRHKWLESEKRGYDIGYSAALVDWVIKHRSKWRNHKKSNK